MLLLRFTRWCAALRGARGVLGFARALCSTWVYTLSACYLCLCLAQYQQSHTQLAAALAACRDSSCFFHLQTHNTTPLDHNTPPSWNAGLPPFCYATKHSCCASFLQALFATEEYHKAAPVTVVTFGSPAVGDKKWADNFDVKINARKLAFNGDLIAQVGRDTGWPLCGSGLHAVHTRCWCTASTN